MTELQKQQCIPCKDAKPENLLSKDKIDMYLQELKLWTLSPTGTFIFKEYTLPNFVKALGFVEQIADIAEEAGHHPDIHIWYNRVRLELSTHSLQGLTQNDFIVASRIDNLMML